MVRVPLLTAQKLLILPAHPLPPEVVRAELQVDRPVCPTFLLVTLPLVQTLSLEAHVLLLLLETLLGQSLGPLRLLAV
jgi:hypothetical protein